MLRTQQDGEEFRETLSSVNEHTAAVAIYLHRSAQIGTTNIPLCMEE